MRIILPTLVVITLLLSVDSGSSLVSPEKETVSTEQNLDVLNYFCVVVINGGWHRFPLFTYLTIEELAYYLSVYDFPLLQKIIFPLLDSYMAFQLWMPLKLYHSRNLYCEGWDTITTYGFMGICTREKPDNYDTLHVILFGFTGLWVQKENSDFAIGFATCAATV